ncbi:hypothetical protein BDN72DRAFT_899670 [Pluteus cervinus]|uniref:Uncharacterized protein n=1 Tax=Pluteus cervinus TaxID=181527 RepID=A0ACD3ALL7_9AGAR|nr:hypothetical protein BDN72DRAFT_899670 [Pluteus cervinus]
MEGFKFWKTSYWKGFLRGKPYHIRYEAFPTNKSSPTHLRMLLSQLAAGDHLRGSYHQLSANPNSLANLDQDLPSNLQHEVPIYSPHEDWLWNPPTTEPLKLPRARQIPKWEKYDAEIARFARKLAKEGRIKSRIATADANVLASTGNANAAPPDTETEQIEEHDVDIPRDDVN